MSQNLINYRSEKSPDEVCEIDKPENFISDPSKIGLDSNVIDIKEVDKIDDGKCETKIHETLEGSEYDDGKVSKEEIRSKLRDIPIEKLKDILKNQVDLEIRLKHKELKLAENEIGKCESQMLMLRKFFEVPSDVKFEDEPSGFTVKYFDLLQKSLSVNYSDIKNSISGSLDQQCASDSNARMRSAEESAQEPGHSYRTRSTTSSLRPSFLVQKQNLGCLYRRTDGIIVKLTCPDCNRSNFSSAQGFLNHSRIAHSKEYTSQDAAALRCGEILPNIEQDEEGLASLNSLKEKNLDPDKNLNVNEIYFNGLSKTLNTVHKNSSCSMSLEKKSPEKQDEDSSLMKKLLSDGVASSENDYKQLIDDAKAQVTNAHLFDDEVEESPPLTNSNQPEQQDAVEFKKLKRRKSRGGINISYRSNFTESDAPSNPIVEDDYTLATKANATAPVSSAVTSATSTNQPQGVTSSPSSDSTAPAPLPKIKLKLRSPSEDAKRRRKN